MTPDEWYISEHYRDEGTVYFGNDHLEIDVYLAKANGDGWHTGVFDRTIGSHPTIPATMGEHGSKPRAMLHVVELVASAESILREFRQSDRYQRARTVRRRSPVTANEQGRLWEYELHRRETAVFGGRMTVDEAVAELREAAP